MVRDQIERRGIKERRLLAALRNVPRHEFVPPSQRDIACHDGPLSIGHDQTISQPYIVAFMTDALRLEGHEKVLEIGTGSGYQTAILAELARSVFTIEIIEPLGREAEERLLRMNYGNIAFRIGNGRGDGPRRPPSTGSSSPPRRNTTFSSCRNSSPTEGSWCFPWVRGARSSSRSSGAASASARTPSSTCGSSLFSEAIEQLCPPRFFCPVPRPFFAHLFRSRQPTHGLH